MARKTEDREDLVRDATAYIRRIEFVVSGQEPIFVGFRAGGEPSFYFGQDHVLQFNSQYELRRAFWQDRMLASYQRRMNWLQRGDGRVRVIRTPLTASEYDEFKRASIERLRGLETLLQNDELAVQGEIPAGGNLEAEMSPWLAQHAGELRLARHPGIGRS
jgi:hypothetical protein